MISDKKIRREGEQLSVGGDATHVVFNFPKHGAMYMGSLVSLSYQLYRDKSMVFNLGETNVNGFAVGKRYVAGSIVKVILLDDDIRQFLQKISTDIGIKVREDILHLKKLEGARTFHHIASDDIISFDIIILMASEYGDWSVAEVIYGATMINSGQVHSIQDLITENTISFIARDVRQTHHEIGNSRMSGRFSSDKKGSQLGDRRKPEKQEEHVTEQQEAILAYWKDKWEQAVNAYSQSKDKDPNSHILIGTLAVLAGVTDPDIKDFQYYDYNAIPDEWKLYINDPLAGRKKNSAEAIEAAGRIAKSTMVGKNNPDFTPINVRPEYRNFTQRDDMFMDLHKHTFLTNGNTEFVEDGDTVIIPSHNIKTDGRTNNKAMYDRITDNGRNTSFAMRLIGIDTPETRKKGQGKIWDEGQPWADEATQFAKRYVSDGRWDRDALSGDVVSTGFDKYGRVLVFNPAYAVAVTEAGLAHANVAGLDKIATPEQIKAIREAEARAKQEKRGIWSGEHPVESPSDFRKRANREDPTKEATGKPRDPLTHRERVALVPLTGRVNTGATNVQ